MKDVGTASAIVGYHKHGKIGANELLVVMRMFVIPCMYPDHYGMA